MFGRYSLFDEVSNLFRNVDNLFRRALEEVRSPFEWTGRHLLPARTATDVSTGATSLPAPSASWWLAGYPSGECFTRNGNLVFRLEMPGVDPNEIEVSVTGNQLWVRGEKKEDRKGGEGNFYFQEMQYGRFERVFTLPEGVKTDDVRATYHNGILEVTLPAEGLAPSKKIPIEVGIPSEKKAIKAA